jgi:hypothetical protein
VLAWLTLRTLLDMGYQVSGCGCREGCLKATGPAGLPLSSFDLILY